MRAIQKYMKTPKKKRRFYDKNGTLIRLGDKLDIPKTEMYFYKDLTVVEKDNQLGLYFVHQDFFIPLETLLDSFFETCEVIKNNITK